MQAKVTAHRRGQLLYQLACASRQSSSFGEQTLGKGLAVVLHEADKLVVLGDGRVAGVAQTLEGILLGSPVVLGFWLVQDIVEVVVVEVHCLCRGQHGE